MREWQAIGYTDDDIYKNEAGRERKDTRKRGDERKKRGRGELVEVEAG